MKEQIDNPVAKLIPTWEQNVPPPEENPYKYNLIVAFAFAEVKLRGLVYWETTVEQYCFRLVRKIDENSCEAYEVVLSSEQYVSLRNVIRKYLKVYVTRGIYDKQCPLMTDKTLPRCLQPTIIE